MGQGFWARIKQEVEIEKRRYSRTCYGKAFGVFIYYLLFTYVPIVLGYIVPYLQTLYSDRIVYCIIVAGTLITVTLAFNATMYFVYTLKMPFFEQYRINPNKPWPWQENSQKFKNLLRRSIKMTLFHMGIVTPVLLYLDSLVEFKKVVDMSLTPSFSEMLPQLLIMLFMEDFFFFSTHWMLHSKALYKYHKVHHEHTTTTTLAGLHSHTFEYLMANVIPAAIFTKVAELYAPLHVTTMSLWIIYRIWDGNNGHCGYNFSWALLQVLPFCTNDDFHDFHHSHNVGNFSSTFRIWDCVFQTNKQFREFERKRQNKGLKAKEA